MPASAIDALLARQAITDVIHRYCRAMDRIDAPLGYSVWHEDGLADYGDIFRGTGRGFIDWVCEFHRGFDSHFHQVGNVLIDLDGERAGSEAYITVGLLFTEAGQRKLTTGRGRYVDRWSRRDGRWAIDQRNYQLDFAFTRPVEASTGWGRRDGDDPSYAVLGAIGRA